VLQSGPRVHGLQSVLHTPVSRQTLTVPITLTEPGPGRSTMLSISPAPVAGTQRLPASDVEKSDGPPRSGVPVWHLTSREHSTIRGHPRGVTAQRWNTALSCEK